MNLSKNARAALQGVVDKFKAGDLSPVAEVARLKRESPVPFDRWSFSNRVLAYVQSGGSTDLRGYRQWQEVDRHVKRGAKAAAYILVPLTYTVEDEETGEEERVMKGFKSVAVFAYCDTEGEPLEHDYRRAADPPPLVDAAEALGVETIWHCAVRRTVQRNHCLTGSVPAAWTARAFAWVPMTRIHSFTSWLTRLTRR